jgi:RNA polymerase sigma factor (sigma-70 family)
VKRFWRELLNVSSPDSDARVETVFRAAARPLRDYFQSATRSPEDAADLVQETALRLIKLARKGPIPSPDLFVWRLARFVLANHFRKMKTRAREIPLDPTRHDRPAESPDLTLSLAVRDLVSRILEDGALNPVDREVFALRYLGLLTFQEIAECSGLSISDAKNRLRRVGAAARVEFQRMGFREDI